MSSFFNERISPEHYARELLHEFNFNSLPIPVEEICEQLGIMLYFLPGLSCESMIGARNSKTVILVDENVKNTERIRFSIAHELGHYKIPSHLKNVYKCTQEDLYHYSPVKAVEMEANRFAGELLMPSKFFESDVRGLPLSLNNIISLANKYGTSVISTAIKYIKTTDDLGAIVLSKDKKISWLPVTLIWTRITFSVTLNWTQIFPLGRKEFSSTYRISSANEGCEEISVVALGQRCD